MTYFVLRNLRHTFTNQPGPFWEYAKPFVLTQIPLSLGQHFEFVRRDALGRFTRIPSWHIACSK